MNNLDEMLSRLADAPLDPRLATVDQAVFTGLANFQAPISTRSLGIAALAALAIGLVSSAPPRACTILFVAGVEVTTLQRTVFVAVIAFAAAIAGVWIGRAVMTPKPVADSELHSLLHNQLDLDAAQHAKLDAFEAQFVVRHKARDQTSSIRAKGKFSGHLNRRM